MKPRRDCVNVNRLIFARCRGRPIIPPTLKRAQLSWHGGSLLMTHRNLAHWIALVACINSAIVFLPTRGDESESVIPANPTDSSN